MSEHLARYFKGQIVAPDHVFRDRRKGKTKVADPAGIHEANLKENSVVDKNCLFGQDFVLRRRERNDGKTALAYQRRILEQRISFHLRQ